MSILHAIAGSGRRTTAAHRTGAAACVLLACLLCILLVVSSSASSAAESAAQRTRMVSATPEVALELSLDPASRRLTGEATWTVPADRSLELRLDRRFSIESIIVDGQPRPLADAVTTGTDRHVVAIGASRGRAQRWQIRWQGELAPLDRSLDHRGVIAVLPAMTSTAGSYLPAGSGWYPESAVPVRYRVSVEMPAAQRAIVPGRVIRETQDAARTHAVFDSMQPIEGITLMAGPYRVDEQMLQIGKRSIRLRTWFTEALQPLAADYLSAAAAYIERFDQRIGDYPFDGFSIVASPLPTGFGLPGATYVGEAVLRLPFMRGQSLAHEILHNWWGNGVWVDWSGGNWSEGLTTYMADHALREQQAPEAARRMRWGWLRDFASIAPSKDTSLDRFVARTHGAASAVGYGKSAMLFHMVRNEIGDAAFDQALRDFWRSHAGRTAGWRDLQAAFERRAGRPLGGLFMPMIGQTGAPSLLPKAATWQASSGSLQITFQDPAPYTVALPAIAWSGDKPERIVLPLRQGERTTIAKVAGERAPDTLQIDPEFSVWRALGPGESPPQLRDVMLAPDTRVLLASNADSAWRMAAIELAGRMIEARPVSEARSTDLRGNTPVLVIGLHDDIERLTRREGPLARPKELLRLPDAAIWAARTPGGGARVFVSTEDTISLIDLHRRAPHYGAQGFVGFRNGKATVQGIGSIEAVRIPVTR